MGRKLTVSLAIALLTFVLAPMASADSIETPLGPLIIPDSSQITSTFVIPSLSGFGFTYGVDFRFSDGTGFDRQDFIESDGGITFTVPVTNLSFSAVLASGGNGSLEASNGAELDPCPGGEPITFCGPGPFDFTLSGPVSSLGWFAESPGFSGIESLSFTVDAGDPPTSSLILLGFGLIGLLVSSRRKARVCP